MTSKTARFSTGAMLGLRISGDYPSQGERKSPCAGSTADPA
jgi:hypothetical protein